jgi:amino acid permease
MQQLSYLSVFSLASILTALIYLFYTDVSVETNSVTTLSDLSGVPYFFGLALFMFEGNALALEIYQQTEEPQRTFKPAIKYALILTSGLVVALGAASY